MPLRLPVVRWGQWDRQAQSGQPQADRAKDTEADRDRVGRAEDTGAEGRVWTADTRAAGDSQLLHLGTPPRPLRTSVPGRKKNIVS